MLWDYLRLAWRGIRRRQVRSWLTVLGIVIGVTAVVALIAIGRGMQNSVKQQFEAIGYDTIIVIPSGAAGKPEGQMLLMQQMMMQRLGGQSETASLNLQTLERLPQVAQVGYLRTETAVVKSPAMQGFLRVTGLSPGITEKFNSYFDGFLLAEGRKFQEGDRFVMILGDQAATDLGVSLGDELVIEGQSFQVIGILVPTEGRGGGFTFRNLDNALFVPIGALEALYGGEGQVSMALVRAAEGAEVAKVAQLVKVVLAQQGTPAGTITAEEISERIGGVLGTIQVTLAAIAAISLLVGGIGVMNTMYTSVLERTREIGVLKAVGAKRKHILSLFLIESGLLGLIGGVIGVLLGAAVSGLAGRFMGRALAFGPLGSVSGGSLVPSLSPGLIVGALALSFLLGALSGAFPARQAARLRPVEALRYE